MCEKLFFFEEIGSQAEAVEQFLEILRDVLKPVDGQFRG